MKIYDKKNKQYDSTMAFHMCMRELSFFQHYCFEFLALVFKSYDKTNKGYHLGNLISNIWLKESITNIQDQLLLQQERKAKVETFKRSKFKCSIYHIYILVMIY